MKPSPSSSRLRSDLFHKLGIQQRNELTPATREPSTGSVLRQVQIRREPLKYDRVVKKDPTTSTRLFGPLGGIFRGASSSKVGESAAALPLEASTESCASVDKDTTGGKPKRALSFNDIVTVALIPKKEEYSNRIRDQLWNSRHELEANAHRNTIEFLAEGCDWRNVTEDEHMYICAQSGEMIHPVHIETLEL